MSLKKYISAFLLDWDKNRTRNHLLFWVGNILFYLFWEIIYGEQLGEAFWVKIFYLPTQVMASYLIIYGLIPQFLLRKKFLLFVVMMISLTYLLCVLNRTLIIYGLEPIISPDVEKDSWFDIFTNFKAILGQYLLLLYITPIFFLLLKYAKDSYVANARLKKLIKEKSITELNFLKAQVHPHFLFNTLNNIYVLALRKSNQTSSTVRKLADMMEYMHTYGNNALVLLDEEIQLIKNYLDLESLRYGDRLDLRTTFSIKNPEIKIAPLMLLSFVENAFKHGVSGELGNPYIHLELVTDDKKLTFRIVNSKNPDSQKDETDYKKGIGVSNVIRQLELIYPDRHVLEIKNTASTYEVLLMITHLHKQPKYAFANSQIMAST